MGLVVGSVIGLECEAFGQLRLEMVFWLRSVGFPHVLEPLIG